MLKLDMETKSWVFVQAHLDFVGKTLLTWIDLVSGFPQLRKMESGSGMSVSFPYMSCYICMIHNLFTNINNMIIR